MTNEMVLICPNCNQSNILITVEVSCILKEGKLVLHEDELDKAYWDTESCCACQDCNYCSELFDFIKRK